MLGGYRERREDHDEHEEVVDRQALLDDVAGEVLGAEVPPGDHPEEHSEGESDADEERRRDGGLPEADLVGVARPRHPQVEREEAANQADRRRPPSERNVEHPWFLTRCRVPVARRPARARRHPDAPGRPAPPRAPARAGAYRRARRSPSPSPSRGYRRHRGSRPTLANAGYGVLERSARVASIFVSSAAAGIQRGCRELAGRGPDGSAVGGVAQAPSFEPGADKGRATVPRVRIRRHRRAQRRASARCRRRASARPRDHASPRRAPQHPRRAPQTGERGGHAGLWLAARTLRWLVFERLSGRTPRLTGRLSYGHECSRMPLRWSVPSAGARCAATSATA